MLPEGADLTTAFIGACFIGVACGTYMLFGGYIAGSSGQLKALVVGPREPRKIAYVAGLALAGVLCSLVQPDLFETIEAPFTASTTAMMVVGGLCIGVGTNLGAGCTSGHGLCGISRFALRSFVATPTFLGTAIVTATLSHGVPWPPSLLPIIPPYEPKLLLAAKLAAGLVPAYMAIGYLQANPEKAAKGVRETLLGLIVGFTFGAGLAIGGMVRPSVVIGALTPSPCDLTLWVLFTSALAVTFGLYRLASHYAAIPPSADGVSASLISDDTISLSKQPTASIKELITSWATPQMKSVDRKLLVGEVLFGIGWGLTGFCPGPLVVGVFGAPQIIPAIVSGSFCVGMVLGSLDVVQGLVTPPDSAMV